MITFCHSYSCRATMSQGIGKFSRAGYGHYASGQYIDYGQNKKEYKTLESSAATDKLTVTNFDLAGKKISGTFNFTAMDKNDTTKFAVITNGSFTDLTWQRSYYKYWGGGAAPIFSPLS